MENVAPLGLFAFMVGRSYQTIAPMGLQNARGMNASDLRAKPHRGGILVESAWPT
jgi:hypothetical protein